MCLIGAGSASANKTDLTEEMKQSLVYLNISAYGYETMQPWKNSDPWEKNGYACAVGPVRSAYDGVERCRGFVYQGAKIRPERVHTGEGEGA